MVDFQTQVSIRSCCLGRVRGTMDLYKLLFHVKAETKLDVQDLQATPSTSLAHFWKLIGKIWGRVHLISSNTAKEWKWFINWNVVSLPLSSYFVAFHYPLYTGGCALCILFVCGEILQSKVLLPIVPHGPLSTFAGNLYLVVVGIVPQLKSTGGASGELLSLPPPFSY